MNNSPRSKLPRPRAQFREALLHLRQSKAAAGWGLDRAKSTRLLFEQHFGPMTMPINEFTAGPGSHVEIIDLTLNFPPYATSWTTSPGRTSELAGAFPSPGGARGVFLRSGQAGPRRSSRPSADFFHRRSSTAFGRCSLICDRDPHRHRLGAPFTISTQGHPTAYCGRRVSRDECAQTEAALVVTSHTADLCLERRRLKLGRPPANPASRESPSQYRQDRRW